MTNILNFPTPKGNHEVPDRMRGTCDKEQIRRLLIRIDELKDELIEFESMSIWRRVVFLFTGY